MADAGNQDYSTTLGPDCVFKGRTHAGFCTEEQKARIMGLAPRKGAIAIGADADLAIIHPTRTHSIDPTTMETNADWSPFEGWELAGFARTTVSRGDVIVDDYRVVGKEGRGVWLRRESGMGNRESKPLREVPIPDSRFPIPAGAR